MAKLSILIGLFLNSFLATAQEANRSLAGDYQPQPVEQALATLTAANRISAWSQVEYIAGQSVVLQPGFEAKAGSVFRVHTGLVLLPASTANEQYALTVSVYPNPSAGVTTITYVLPEPGRTSLQVFGVDGKLIRQFIVGHYQEAGRHSVEWTGDGVPAGLYVCILDAGFRRITRRIIRK